MHRQSDRDHRRAEGWARRPAALLPALVAAALALPLTGAAACSTPETTVASPSSASGASDDAADPPPSRKRPPREVHTANPDRRTFANQPDYDGDAASLREYMRPRMPTPPPRDREAACAAMFAAADTFYASIETDAARRAEVAANLKATRRADQDACVRETSASAATCVTLLLGDRTAEFAWLIDQCSRAYPGDA
ncbi:MAG: hypothetical protein R3A79_22440 [Nannocystaceae bacterium]